MHRFLRFLIVVLRFRALVGNIVEVSWQLGCQIPAPDVGRALESTLAMPSNLDFIQSKHDCHDEAHSDSAITASTNSRRTIFDLEPRAPNSKSKLQIRKYIECKTTYFYAPSRMTHRQAVSGRLRWDCVGVALLFVMVPAVNRLSGSAHAQHERLALA